MTSSKEVKCFKKRLNKPFVEKSKYNYITLNHSFIRPGKMGLTEIWPDFFCDIDKYWELDPIAMKLDAKNSSFYRQFAHIREPARIASEESYLPESLETFVENKRQEMDFYRAKKETETKKKITFFDQDQEFRCVHFLKGIACSSNCNYIHASPEDDGIYCKYYYLQRNCPSSHCSYYHGKVCSSKTKKVYEDKYEERRCPKIMNRKSCTDSTCEKRHRLPKEDNVYCFDQLSLECRFESECLYKHRKDLNSYCQRSMMEYRNDSDRCDIQQKSKTECENVINSESTKTSEENTSDEGSHSSLSNFSDDSDRETISSGPEYYFPSSDDEDNSRAPPPLYSGLGNLVRNLKADKELPKSTKESKNKNNYFHSEKTNSPSFRPLETLIPYEDSETSSTDSDAPLASDFKSSDKMLHKSDSRMKELREGNSLVVKKERELFDININDFIVHDPSEISSENIELTSTQNERYLHKSPVRKGSESPDPICLKIKMEVPLIVISSDEEEPQEKQEVSNSSKSLKQDFTLNIKKEVNSENISTSVKTETCNKGNDPSNSGDLLKILGVNKSSDPVNVKKEILTSPPLFNVKRECENFDSLEANKSFINEFNNIFQQTKRIKLEQDFDP